jgi:hypothetical protein
MVTYVSLDGLIELLDRWHDDDPNDATTKFEWDQLVASDAHAAMPGLQQGETTRKEPRS